MQTSRQEWRDPYWLCIWAPSHSLFILANALKYITLKKQTPSTGVSYSHIKKLDTRSLLISDKTFLFSSSVTTGHLATEIWRFWRWVSPNILTEVCLGNWHLECIPTFLILTVLTVITMVSGLVVWLISYINYFCDLFSKSFCKLS